MAARRGAPLDRGQQATASALSPSDRYGYSSASSALSGGHTSLVSTSYTRRTLVIASGAFRAFAAACTCSMWARMAWCSARNQSASVECAAATAPRGPAQRAEIGYNAPFTVELACPQSIAFVSLIRPGLTTHSPNVEERPIDVPKQVVAPTGLRVEVDIDDPIAPPGWYVLFLTDTGGVPSVAHWVHLS